LHTMWCLTFSPLVTAGIISVILFSAINHF
jgi:hypothetical protein